MIKNWLKNKLGITDLERENAVLKKIVAGHGEFVIKKMAELKSYTRVDADIGVRGDSTVILTGVYRGKGYVRFYDVKQDHFNYLVQDFEDKKRHALIRNIDHPPCFHGVFNILDK